MHKPPSDSPSQPAPPSYQCPAQEHFAHTGRSPAGFPGSPSTALPQQTILIWLYSTRHRPPHCGWPPCDFILSPALWCFLTRILFLTSQTRQRTRTSSPGSPAGGCRARDFSVSSTVGVSSVNARVHVGVCICICTSTCICMYILMYTYVHVCMSMHMSMHVYMCYMCVPMCVICICTSTRICTRLVCAHVHAYACIYVYVCTCICVCAYAQGHAYVYVLCVYMHMYVCRCT